MLAFHSISYCLLVVLLSAKSHLLLSCRKSIFLANKFIASCKSKEIQTLIWRWDFLSAFFYCCIFFIKSLWLVECFRDIKYFHTIGTICLLSSLCVGSTLAFQSRTTLKIRSLNPNGFELISTPSSSSLFNNSQFNLFFFRSSEQFVNTNLDKI